MEDGILAVAVVLELLALTVGLRRRPGPEVPRPSGPKFLFGVVMVVQILATLAILVLPFGFDHPSSWGLDFEDFLLMLFVYGLALLTGTATCLFQRRWLALALQLLVPAMVILVWFVLIPLLPASPIPPASQWGAP